jgi:fatty-acyl-CoA synthase
LSNPRESLPSAILRSLTSRRATYAFAGKPAETLEAKSLARRIAGTSLRMKAVGLQPGRILPLLCPTSPESWTCFVAAMAAGLTPANLSLPTFKTHVPTYLRNLEALMERYGTDTVLASKDARERLVGRTSREVRWIDVTDLQAEADVRSAADPSSSVAFLQHSSGSTGVPKGVALTHEAVLAHLRAYANAIHLDPERDLIASWLPLYHDMGLLTSFLLPLVEGVSCRSMTPETFVLNPLGFVEDMAKSGASLSWWPNFAFALLAERHRASPHAIDPGLSLRRVRALVNCSEVVMPSSMDAFAEAFAGHALAPGSIHASYAMAENVFAVTQTVGAGPARVEVDGSRLQPSARPLESSGAPNARRTLASSGRRIDNVDIRIVDENRREVGEGVVGEIAISGPFLFAEYLGLADETPAQKADGWYFTRDLGFRLDHELYVLGRGTDLIVVGGRKFLPNEVERIAGSVGGVKAGRVVAFGARSTSKGTEDAIAMVESPDAADPARRRAIRREIVQAVLQQMDLALADVAVVEEGSLIKTSSGKIARNDNREAWLASKSGEGA